MTNHYHLLVETPKANLGRIMRHINGVYTQRHNLLKKTDGPLFRGRYKSVLVDEESYLLQLTRYIHYFELYATTRSYPSLSIGGRWRDSEDRSSTPESFSQEEPAAIQQEGH